MKSAFFSRVAVGIAFVAVSNVGAQQGVPHYLRSDEWLQNANGTSAEKELALRYLMGVVDSEAETLLMEVQTLSHRPGKEGTRQLGRKYACVNPYTEPSEVMEAVKTWMRVHPFEPKQRAFAPIHAAIVANWPCSGNDIKF